MRPSLPARTSLDRLEVVQGNLRATVEPHSDGGRAGSDRRIANHGTMPPSAGAHAPGHDGVKLDRDPAGEADLTPVGMSAQHDIKARMSGLVIHFWGMREKDREFIIWDCGRCFFDIFDAVEMSIVDASQMHALAATRDCH